MKRIRPIFAGRMHIVAGVIGVVALSALLLPAGNSIRLEPTQLVVSVGEEFVMHVVVEVSAPANVFAGDVHFDTEVLAVESISYNTSIADVWVEKPWYEDGEGTIDFGGGTTVRGGFAGRGELMTIAFRTLREGEATLSLKGARILLSDGLGTDAEVMPPIDAVITIDTAETAGAMTSNVRVVRTAPSMDLDGDGAITYADVSAFVFGMAGGGEALDFDDDGSVGISDFRLLLSSVSR